MISQTNNRLDGEVSHEFPWRQIAAIGLSILIILAITLSLYRVFEQAILQEISTMTSVSSKQLDNLTLNLQRFLHSYGMQMFYSPSVSKLRESTDITNYDKVLGLRELGTFVTTSGFADSIHVYNGSLGYIYTTSPQHSGAAVDRFYDRGASEIFKDLKLSDRMRPIRRSYESSLGGHGPSTCYSFMLFETDSEGEPYKNAVMINIAPEWFNKMLLNNYSGDSAVIVDLGHNIIATHKTDPEGELAPFLPLITNHLEQGDSSGYFIGKGIGDDRTVCLYSKMAANDWIFIQTMRYGDCMSGMLTLRNNAFFVFFLLIALLLVGILVSLIRIYFPFRQMVRAVSKITTENVSVETETLPLPEQLDAFVESSIQMRPAFDRMLRERAVLTLLEHPEQVDAEILGLAHGQPVIVVIMCCGDTQEIVSLAQQYFSNAEGAINNSITVMLLPTDETARVELLCQAISADHNCRCIYSEPLYDYSHVARCYLRLLEVEALHCLFPDASVLCESLLSTRNKESSFFEKDVVTLSSRLKSGDLDAARSIYEHILNTVSNDSYNDLLFALNRLNRMTDKLLSECVRGADNPCEVVIRPIDKLMQNANTLSEITDYFDAIFIEITKMNALHRQAKSRAVVDSVIEIIQADYANPSLSSHTIADSLGFSNVHLGRQFRVVQECSISDYLNRVRVEHACELLLKKSANVEDIARMVGFENSKYFYVLFKNSTGLTPRQYRLQQQKEE